jgi:transcriptional regulator with XRE-family HTH domain
MTLVDLTDDLGKRVKARRTRLNLSQRESAELLGVSLRTLQNWEAGETFPWPKHRRAIQQFLADGVPPRGRTSRIREQAGAALEAQQRAHDLRNGQLRWLADDPTALT